MKPAIGRVHREEPPRVSKPAKIPAILGVELALLALLACSRDEHNIKVT
jgi:hypothetical protein